MRPYVVIDKQVGETPLSALEQYRSAQQISTKIPMAYAGRLDPMASGKLLVLIDDECKKQRDYHQLDKAYRFEVLFGTSSDSADVLGLLEWQKQTPITHARIETATNGLMGPLSLPYPKFSAKPVNGKPLHTWTLENRLDEIEIPIAHTMIYDLRLESLRRESARSIYEIAAEKIETIPPVTEDRKGLGADFRRADVRLSWQTWLEYHNKIECQIATFYCICSSGSYMRSLAEEIGLQLGTKALAFSIHRELIGKYTKLPFGFGFWRKTY